MQQTNFVDELGRQTSFCNRQYFIFSKTKPRDKQGQPCIYPWKKEDVFTDLLLLRHYKCGLAR